MPDVDETESLRDALTAALGVRRWVDEVVAGAPYGTLDELVAAARAATPLTPAEVDEALAHHPRIGERPAGTGAAQQHSRREQASSDADDPELAARLAAGNAAYEQRFGRIFLVRAAGRTRAEIVAELERRLTLDDATEATVVAGELRDIAVRRLLTLGDRP
jgi:2-oxo-4-hydroxy-4-carboxy-5-ureidoimidazoline decarboxylase